MRSGLVVALVIFFASSALAQSAPRPLGVELLPWATKIEENRYKSPRDWEKTYKVFRDRWRRSSQVKIHREVNLPGVKYIHFESLNPKTKWAGLNMYQLQGKPVRIYVIPRAAEKPEAAPQK